MKKCTGINITPAENGTVVRCDYEEEREVPAQRKGDQPYTTKDYSTKTYTGPADLHETVLALVGEEIEEEKPQKRHSRVTKLSNYKR